MEVSKDMRSHTLSDLSPYSPYVVYVIARATENGDEVLSEPSGNVTFLTEEDGKRYFAIDIQRLIDMYIAVQYITQLK